MIMRLGIYVILLVHLCALPCFLQVPCVQQHEWSAHSLHHYWNNQKLTPTDLARRTNLLHGQLIALGPHVCPL